MRAALGCLLGLLGCSGAPDVVARVHDDYDPNRPPTTLALSGDLFAHDPSVIEANGKVYLFYTGAGIRTKVSDDFVSYRAGPSVFDANPAWIAERVPDATDLWSPDIAYFGGEYHLYYAASTFASRRSCIGHATSSSLGERIAFRDRGPVICSNTGTTADDFNAIDPNLILDGDKPYLAFGSFSGGLKLVALDAAGERPVGELIPIAARSSDNPAVQAAYVSARAGYYYLFSSFDLCCDGANSSHRLMVGRSSALAGPYVDRAGKALLDGGGSLVLESNERWRGPGSNSVLYRAGKAYNVYHAYDADNDGAATLRIGELAWDAVGWPISGGP
ncbi:MAG: arabinan endo-1,5-alpha-L-arabinosidase [Myxococcota bacterium]